jgi:acetyl-CoA C-acetyltransferase
VAARRTPFARPGGGLADQTADELAAAVLRALVAELGPRSPRVDQVVLGVGPGGDEARFVALSAGLGVDTPGVTVTRAEGSGLDAVRVGAALVRSGEARLVLAGGADSASTSPGVERTRSTPEPYADPDPVTATELLATRLGIARQRQDAYAARSHSRAAAGRASGAFAAEIVPVAGLTADPHGQVPSEADLAKLTPERTARGTVTAGNSCDRADGAAAVALVSERVRAALRIPGLALIGLAVAGVDPEVPGLAPVPAVTEAMERAGCAWHQVGLVELDEASAAQVLACAQTWGLDALSDRTATPVCPHGGALALGRPRSAAGAFLVVRLFASMVRQESGPVIGVAAGPVGAGQGVAIVAERVG